MHQIDHHGDGLAAVLHQFGKWQSGQDGREHAVGGTPQTDGQSRTADDRCAQPAEAGAQLSHNPRAHSAAVSVRQHPEPTGECSPKCGQGQGAHDHAAGPNPKVVGCVPPNGLDQQHDGADHRQPHARAEGAEKPCGQQCPQAAHGILDVFPFIGGGHEFRGCVGHVVGQQRQRTEDGRKQEPGADQWHQGGLELVESIDSEQRLALLGRGLLFSRHDIHIGRAGCFGPEIEALARTFCLWGPVRTVVRAGVGFRYA